MTKPTSLWLALGAASVFVLGILAGSIAGVAQGDSTILAVSIKNGLHILILVGLFRGNRLAWQWGRLGSIYKFVLFLVAAGAGKLHIVELLFNGVLIPTIFFALGRPAARTYFRLVCPQCGAFTRSGANLLFSKARCLRCRREW